MNQPRWVLILLATALMGSCIPERESSQRELRAFEITNLDDVAYPDNPDIGFRSKDYQADFFSEGKMEASSRPFVWSFSFFTRESDSILLQELDLAELIPTIPNHVKSSPYLSYIACVNQEWNRNQVRFEPSEFSSTLPQVSRVDLARNCLNAYLWEIILYVKENGQNLPFAHGWFEFPHDLYAQLFETKNQTPFAKYKKPLEDWVDPQNEAVDMGLLRRIVDTLDISFEDLSDHMYPLTGARRKKFKEIVYPESFSTMRDLQSDSSLFATFSIPGYYNRQNPRKTELGRIHHLEEIRLFKVHTPTSEKPLTEIRLQFEHKATKERTFLTIGGIDLDQFPVLAESEANQGWKNSMGIGNHTFYESYQENISHHAQTSAYYAMLTDTDGNWLDSHQIGIDGPLFHFTDEGRKNLHLWLLSFERHALVGHYSIRII